MDRLTGMAIFARVVDAKSFTHAARRLGISKSTVSKHVTALERRLSLRLVNRTTRRLSLTEAGQAFYESCQRIVDEVEAAEAALSQLRRAPQGTLRVNAPMSFGLLHIVPAIPEFLRRYPAVKVDLHMDDRVIDLVGEGFDVAVRIARLPDSRLVARRLAPNRLVVCAAPSYLAGHGVPRTPSDLSHHNCLSYTYLSTHDQWHFRGPQGPTSVRVSGTFRANNGDALRDAAVAGIGIVHLPSFLAWRELRSGALRSVLTSYAGVDAFLHAVYPYADGHPVPPKVRVFVDFLVARFGPRPYWDRARRDNGPGGR